MRKADGSPALRAGLGCFFAATAGLAMATGLAGCKKPAAANAPPPPVVVVAKVQQHDVTPYEIRTGTISASQTATILPRVSGFVDTIPFKPGDFVTTKTVLFTLDSRSFKAQLEQAKATLEVRKSDVNVSTAQLAAAKANLKNADEELDRQERLQKQNATSEKELMNARNNQRAAAASVESAEAAVVSAKASVDAATAAVEAAQVNLDYCTITAPIAGKVDTNNVDVGDLVSMSGPKLTTVRAIDSVKVDFTLSEPLVVQFLKNRPAERSRLSIPVKVSIGDDGEFVHDAMLNFISNTVDQATGTIVVQALAKNENLKLFPGLFVRVKVELMPLRKAIVVAESAIGRDIGGDYVWVIKADSTAEKRYIKPGPLVENLRVVKGGLAAGETYVVQGIQRVRERGKVTPQPAPAHGATRPAATQPAKG